MEIKELIEEARLRYVTDKKPGITRKVQAGEAEDSKNFAYFDTDGELVTDEKTLERIKKLVIPPAWTDVWICPSPNGYLQVTGRDAKGRKQYRYHERWNKGAQAYKFEHMLEFANVLPKIRQQVKSDMAKQGMPKEKVVATIVWLLENTLIRVGNEEYVKENKSYGLTTLKNRHVDVDGNSVLFEFKGKSGVFHEVKVRSKRVAKIIAHCQDLPGQDLFGYRDDEGNMQKVTSDDVNTYLREITGQEITAKDFRTWAGTVIAAMTLDEIGVCEEKIQAKKNTVEVVKRVASQLRNKPATSRKYYIHPVVLAAYEQQQVLSTVRYDEKYKLMKEIEELDECENGVVRMLSSYSHASQS